MANFKDWIQATRPNTLPASLAPVLMGIGGAIGAYRSGKADFSLPTATTPSTLPTPWGLSLLGSPVGYLALLSVLCLLVALFLQVGVNFSNDYSDGIRGTDHAQRMGPARLTGSGAAPAKQVLLAALGSFALAAVFGLLIILLSQSYWLLLAGVAAILAAWFYTGGRRPYGYLAGISELMVFIFFGLLATLGTIWVQVFTVTAPMWAGASGVGLLSCALLMVNNLRDIPTDQESGKMTLAVRLGDTNSRYLIAVYLLIASLLAAYATGSWRGVIVAGLLLAGSVVVVIPIFKRVTGPALIPSLKKLGFLTLLYGLLLTFNWALFGF